MAKLTQFIQRVTPRKPADDGVRHKMFIVDINPWRPIGVEGIYQVRMECSNLLLHQCEGLENAYKFAKEFYG